jgi:Ca2+-binding RTX toxin-like protein
MTSAMDETVGLQALINDDMFSNKAAFYDSAIASQNQVVAAAITLSYSLANFIGLAAVVYFDPLPTKTSVPIEINGTAYTIIDSINDQANSYQGLILFDKSSDSIIVVNRGSQEAGDFGTDAKMFLANINNQWADAEKLGQEAADYAKTHDIATIYSVGHSLGGTLTQLQATKFGWTGVTFNAYGAGELLANYGLTQSSTATITNYRDMFDVVSDASTQVGSQPVTIETPADQSLLASGNYSNLSDLISTIFGDHGIGNFYSPDSGPDDSSNNGNLIFNEALAFSLAPPSTQLVTFAEDLVAGVAEVIQLEILGDGTGGNLSVSQAAIEAWQYISGQSVSGIKAVVPLDSTLLANALNSSASNNIYRASLVALSPVVLQGVDPNLLSNYSLWAPGQSSGLTKDFLTARNDMVLAMVTLAGAGQLPGGSVNSSGRDSYVYSDLTRSASPLYTLDGQGGNTYDVVFADDKGDALTVSPGANAELFGGAGNDTLFGGTVGSTLQGGAGNDDYVIDGSGSGVDYILDTDGKGTIEWKSSNGSTETLTGGTDQAGTPDWKSADGLFTYTEDLSADGSTELEILSGSKTVYIDDFTNGEFGITLSTPSTPPLPSGTLQVDAQNSFSPGLISAVEFDDSGSQAPIAAVLVGPTDTSGQIWTINGIGNASSIYGGTGAEFLIADSKALDSVSGSVDAQSFYIQAGAGAQSIVGAQGHDTLVGGSDTLAATTVQVTYSDGTAATLPGERGFDWITGGGGNDLIEAGAGSTLIEGGTGNDTIFGGNGDDTIYAGLSYYGDGQSDDAIANLYDSTGVVDDTYLQGIGGAGLAGAGSITGTSTNLIVAGTGNDLIFGGLGNDTIYGGMGKDTIVGNAGSNLIYGGAGQSVIYADENASLAATYATNWQDAGSTYSDTIIGGSGNSTIFGSGGNDLIEAGGGNDHIVLGNGNNHVWADAGNVTITGSKGNDVIDAGTGNDYINVGAGNVSVFTGSGNNTVYAGAGSDTVIADSGADTIAGSSGALTYIAGTSTGTGTIQRGGGNITLKLTDGLSESNLLVRDVNGDLVLSDPGFSTQVTVTSYFSNAGGVSFLFDDGTSWDAEQILKASVTARTDGGNDTLIGSDGNDTITAGYGDTVIDGTSGNNILTGGAGDDTIDGGNGTDSIEGGLGTTQMYGGAGRETYVFNIGDGSDSIIENTATGGDDTLTFGAGIDPSDVTFTRVPSSNDLLIQFGTGTASSVTVKNFLGASSSQHQISTFAFADGTTLSGLSVIQQLSAITGSTGADYLYGTPGADYFDGKGGNDYEDGDGGNDTFVFNAGYGQLEISVDNRSAQDQSVLQLGAGITVSALHVTTDGGNLYLTDGVSGDLVTLDSEFSENTEWHLQEVNLVDGTILTRDQLIQMELSGGTPGGDTLVGTPGADLIDGKGGSDYEIGGGGNDTFVFHPGYGQLQIREVHAASEQPVLQLGAGIALSSLRVTVDEYGQLMLTDGIGGDQITLDEMLPTNYSQTGIQSVQLADGTTLSAPQLVQMEVASGTAGDESIIGTYGADLIDGKGGNDTVTGNGGDDTFVFNSGYGQLEINEINQTNASNQQSVLKLGAGITASALHVTTDGTGTNLYLTDGVSGDQIALAEEWDYNYGYGVSRVELSDGTILTPAQLIQMEIAGGTAGDDTLYGTSSADLIDGKGGSDAVFGGGGNDTFVFDPGYGQLSIDEQYTSGQQPVLQLGSGITIADLHVTTDVDGDIFLSDGISGDQITLDNEWDYQNGSGVLTVELNGGTTLTPAQLIQMEIAGGTAGDDSLYGTSDADVLDGKGGSDYARGNGGNDTFVFQAGYGRLEIDESYTSDQIPILQLGAGITSSSLRVTTDLQNLYLTDGVNGDQITLDNMWAWNGTGVAEAQLADGTKITSAQLVQMAISAEATAGSDTIYGTAGADLIDGMGGNDMEIGQGGSDTFVFNPGYGQLEIEEDYTSGQQPVLQLGSGITASALQITTDGWSLFLADGVTGDQVELYGMFGITNGEGVQEVKLADGTTLTAAQLVQMASSVSSTSAARSQLMMVGMQAATKPVAQSKAMSTSADPMSVNTLIHAMASYSGSDPSAITASPTLNPNTSDLLLHAAA